MKILFLDIDGVVNCEKTFQTTSLYPLDKYMAFMVGKIQLDTDCKVVLSSSWRHHPDGVKVVDKHVVRILDITPSIPVKTYAELERGHEIQAWLDAHPEVTKYAILDDDSDMLPEQKNNFFQTSWKEGLTEEIMKRVIEHLNTP